MRRSGALVVAGIVLALAVGFGGGFAFDRLVVLQGAPPTEPADAQATFGIFWEAWRLVEEHYVDPASATPQQLTQGAIAGMLNALGDTGHTRYLTAADRQAQDQSLSGQLQGIGVEVEVRNGQLTVVAPLDGSPAQRAGIQPGDVIEKVDGQDVSSVGLDKVSQMIRGPQGSSVQLTVLRPGVSEFLEFTLVRQDLTVPDVTWATVPGAQIAHVRISEFGQNTDDQLRAALTQAIAANDKVILDLRNDPGGILDQAVKVASEFLPSGNVLLEKDRSGNQHPDPVQSGGIATKVPLVVLVNRGTASAAEIVAGAIQDQNRGAILGEQTFGTGTVLHEYVLSDGSAVLLGELEWLTPNGHSIRNNGITPNTVIAEPPTALPLSPLEERKMTPDQLQQSNDVQLLDAIKALQ